MDPVQDLVGADVTNRVDEERQPAGGGDSSDDMLAALFVHRSLSTERSTAARGPIRTPHRRRTLRSRPAPFRLIVTVRGLPPPPPEGGGTGARAAVNGPAALAWTRGGFHLPEGFLDQARVVLARHVPLQELRSNRDRQIDRFLTDLLHRTRGLELDLLLGVL